VRDVIKGKANHIGEQVDDRTDQTFNDHCAAISTDADYRALSLK